MTETAPGLVHTPVAGTTNWYRPAMIGCAGQQNLAPDTMVEAGSLPATLTPDDYSIFLRNYYTDGLRRFVKDWGYADAVTVLLVLADHVQPRNHLEISMRRGRSACAVVSRAPACDRVMFDMWVLD
jgi:hypothetical protein